MKPTVYLVDDDDAVRAGLTACLKNYGFNVRAFSSGRDFLRRCRPQGPGCVLLDLKMPDMSGLTVQEVLVANGIDMPIIFMSAYATVQDSVKAMKTGACDFLQKPFSSPLLLERIHEVLAQDRTLRERLTVQEQTRALYSRLTEREKEITELVVSGHTSKDIAAALGISPRTVDHHRTSVLVKFQVESIAELATLVAAGLGENHVPSDQAE